MNHLIEIFNPTFYFVLALIALIAFVTWFVYGSPLNNLTLIEPHEENKSSVEIKDITCADKGKHFRILEEETLEFCIIQIGENNLPDDSDAVIGESYWIHRIEQLKDYHKDDIFTVREGEHHTRVRILRGIVPYTYPYKNNRVRHTVSKNKTILN